MTRAEILEHIVDDLRDNILVIHSWTFPVTEETHLIEDLALDSLQMVELVMGVEEIFAFEVEDDEATAWTSVGNVVDTVERFFGGA